MITIRQAYQFTPKTCKILTNSEDRRADPGINFTWLSGLALFNGALIPFRSDLLIFISFFALCRIFRYMHDCVDFVLIDKNIFLFLREVGFFHLCLDLFSFPMGKFRTTKVGLNSLLISTCI